jgi:hypothetical protein
MTLDNGGSTSNGGIVIQEPQQSDDTNQEWQLLSVGGGYYNLICQKSGLALDNSGATSNGGTVWQWTPQPGNTNQEWQLVNVGDGYCNLICLTSGLALDNEGSTTAGNGVWQWTPQSGNTNQEWQFALVSSSLDVALTPPMGWSSWSFLRENVTQSNIEADALALHNSPLQSYGFQYVNIDDGWYLNPATNVDTYGRWEVNTSTFPNGLSGVATYVHGLGLKFGMYLTPGIPVAAYNQNTPIQGTSYTARNIVSNTTDYEANYQPAYGGNVMYYIDYTKPGAQAFLNSWANLLASWGVDYVKLDGVGDGDMADVEAWSAALKQTGRPIHLELSNALDINNGAFWRQYANGWRTTGDIEDYGGSTLTDWSNVEGRFSSTPGWQEWGGPGAWNDLDSLEIGNGTNDGLTTAQRQTTETLWVMAASPLILGTDLTNLNSTDLTQLSNAGVLGIDQNGVAGAPVAIATQEVWRARQPDGSYAVALFNLGTSSTSVSATWSSMGFLGKATVYDLWSGTNLGQFSNTFSATLASDASRLLRVTPQIYAVQYLADSSANTLSGGAVPETQSTATDGGDVGYIGEGGVLQFGDVIVNKSGLYSVIVLYYDGDSGRSANISINGGTASSYSFTGTSSWSTLLSKTIQLQLQAGTNTISFSNPSAYAPDIDSITVQPTAAVVPGTGEYEIQCVASGLAVNVSGASTSDGAAIIQWPYNGSSNSLWTFVATSNGYYQIKNVNSGLDVAVLNASTSIGAAIIQWSYGSAGNDQWEPVQNNYGTYTFYNLLSGLALDDPQSSTSQGTQFDQALPTGGSNQTFNLISE